MALLDVKQYYFTMLAQYLEMKDDLADFEQAVRDGHITEDQLAVVKKDFAEVERNYNRLSYIMYLLELPKKKSKRLKYTRNKLNCKVEAKLRGQGADVQSVIDENTSMITHLRNELKRLVEANK